MNPKGALAGEIRRYLASRKLRFIASAVSVAAFVAVWHVLAYLLRYWDVGFQEFLPYPLPVFSTLIDSFTGVVPGIERSMGSMALASLKRLILGFTLALAIAFPLGLLMASVRLLRYLGEPIVEMFRPIPPVAWIPIFLVTLSMFWGPVWIVFLGAFFPILLNVMFGVRRTDETLIDAAKTLGADSRDIFKMVIIPSTMPYLMTGVKVGLGIGWMCIVAAEMLPVLGGGVGYALWTSANQYSLYEVTYACMIVIGLMSLITTGLAEQFEKKLYAWMGMER